jgi:SAM-dependent methyltransferase
MPDDASYSKVILEHYRREAELHGRDASSTMRDEVTRGREVAGVLRVLEFLAGRAPLASLLDVGCGNAYLLSAVRARFPESILAGVEYTPEMCALAQERAVAACPILQGDVRQLPFEDGRWSVVVTERCIINLMDRTHQADALREIARVLEPGGHFICIEAFTDGLDALNEARGELGMPPHQQPHHNSWFEKSWFLDTINSSFEVVDLEQEADPSLPPPNFLSSHYFISRVLYPAVTSREILYNTHLVKFFSFLPPMGNYSPIQLYVLRKK